MAAEAIKKMYSYKEEKGIGHYVSLFARNNKLLGVEVAKGEPYFGTLGDVDFKVSHEIKGDKIILTASENARRIIEEASNEKKQEVITPEKEAEMKAELSASIDKANQEYAKQGKGLLSVAKIVVEIQQSDSWKLLGFTSWEKFAKANFDFQLDSIKEALGVVKKSELLEVAEQVGITKAYILSRKTGGVSQSDIDKALDPKTSVRSLATDLDISFAGNGKGNTRGTSFSWKALNNFLEKVPDEKGLLDAKRELNKSLDSINSRLAGIEERRSKRGSMTMEEVEEFKAFQAWKASQGSGKGLVTHS